MVSVQTTVCPRFYPATGGQQNDLRLSGPEGKLKDAQLQFHISVLPGLFAGVSKSLFVGAHPLHMRSSNGKKDSSNSTVVKKSNSDTNTN
jgi:hypothetical protein